MLCYVLTHPEQVPPDVLDIFFPRFWSTNGSAWFLFLSSSLSRSPHGLLMSWPRNLEAQQLPSLSRARARAGHQTRLAMSAEGSNPEQSGDVPEGRGDVQQAVLIEPTNEFSDEFRVRPHP